MRLNELKSVFLKDMGYYTQDLSRPGEFEQFMPEALAFMNEGYALVASHCRFKDTQRVTLEGEGKLPFDALRYPFLRCAVLRRRRMGGACVPSVFLRTYPGNGLL